MSAVPESDAKGVEGGVSPGSPSWAQVTQGKKRCRCESTNVTEEAARLKSKVFLKRWSSPMRNM